MDYRANSYYVHYTSVDKRFIATGEYRNRLRQYLTYGILSRHLLEQYPLAYGKDYILFYENFNDDDYVSILRKYQILDVEGNAFNQYSNKIALVISNEILQYLNIRTGSFRKMPREIQIKDGIPIEFILGIEVPFYDNLFYYDKIYELIENRRMLLYNEETLEPLPRFKNDHIRKLAK